MAQSKGLRNMTVGSPAGHIFYFALPLLAGSFLQQFYNMVDSWVVGNYVGDGALAAVGVGAPVIFLFSSLFMGVSNGGTVVIAQFFGAGKPERVRDAIDTVYTAFVCGAVPLSLIAVALVKPLLFALRVEEAAYGEAFTYLIVVCAGLVGTIGYNLNAGVPRHFHGFEHCSGPCVRAGIPLGRVRRGLRHYLGAGHQLAVRSCLHQPGLSGLRHSAFLFPV